MSKFESGIVEKNSSTINKIRSSGRNRTYACAMSVQVKFRFLPEDLIVDDFFSTLPGSNFDMCIISTRTKTHLTLQKILHIE